jgi:hypothetical protein
MTERGFERTREVVTLHVRLLADPALWCWEIRDASGGQLLGSSWEDEWTGYETSQEAWAAGLARMRQRRQRHTV